MSETEEVKCPTPSAEVYQPESALSAGARVKSSKEYERMHKMSLEDNDGFWKKAAEDQVSWFAPFDTVKQGSFEHGDLAWYLGGKLNVSYNCLDRHVKTQPNKVALLWEGDEPGDCKKFTYADALRETCKFANALKRAGVRKGDSVCLYMPMVPEAAFAMLACARIGAPHSVVFAGFSAEALKDRLIDGNCHFLLTANEGLRGSKAIPLKKTCDTAMALCPEGFVKTCMVLQRTKSECNMVKGRDVWWHDAIATERGYCPPEWMDSEDVLFMLFTSGSTGRPKGIQHSTGGYLVYTSLTHKYVFDLKPDDVYACVADVGWITGHSYIVYGPLCNGATTVMFESTPLYPDAGRYWDMVQRHKITQLYTAPTAIRALMKYGEEYVNKYDLSSLRVLGTVGEPINPEAWKWYFDVVGKGKRYIVDTYWQTETGGIVVTPLPGATPQKPGAACTPFFGIELGLMDDEGKEIEGNDVSGILVVKKPWPGQARTIFGDHKRFLNVYMTAYPGYYFTGDGCIRDKDGSYWITGRVDDVINVSGHRLGSAEIESALVEHEAVVEAAVVGVPHACKGSSLFAFVTCKSEFKDSPELQKSMRETVKRLVGSFAKPDDIVLAAGVPKTRSGKIMRRLLRKVACGETDVSKLGDISTLADASVVSTLIDTVTEHLKAKNAC